MVGITETFVLPGTRGMSARVTVSETYDAVAETSDVSIAVDVESSVYAGHIYYLTGAVAAAGKTLQTMDAYMGTHYVYVQTLNTGYAIETDSTSYRGSPWHLSGIAHEIDGSKKITVSVDLSGDQVNGWGADGWTVTGSKEVTLTHFPKASSVAATDAAVGAVSMVAINRCTAAYTHSLEYEFGQLHGFLSPQGVSGEETVFADVGVAFRIPETFYSQIPNAKSGICTLTCWTWCENGLVGEPQSASFTVLTDAGVCAPLVEASVTDVNPETLALTGDADTLVRYVSNAECIITATARKQATIKQKRIGGTVITGDRRTVQGIETGTVVFAAEDSRGYSTSKTVKKNLIPYVHLSCNPVCKRTNPTSGETLLSVSGDYFAGSFGIQDNALTLRCRVNEGQWQEILPEVKDNTYTAQVLLTGLNYTQSHTVLVQVSDKLQTAEKTVLVGKGIPVFDWGEQDFSFHVPVYLLGGGIYNSDGSAMYAPATESAQYPGCYYRTVDGETEWINPPMVAGVEYRTTERWNGQSVYRKLISCGRVQKQMTVTAGMDNIRIIHANISVFNRVANAESFVYWIDMMVVRIQAGDAQVADGGDVYAELVYVYR